MSNYTKALTAEQLIYFIANDRPELSHEKVLWQRNEYIKICREWLELNGQYAEEIQLEKENDNAK